MSNNMEMKTVNIKRKGENCIDYKKKIIHDTKLL